MPVTYIPTCMLVQKVPSGVEKRALMILAGFFLFFVNLLLGPSKIFNFPDNIYLIITALALRGILDPFTLIPSLPEMIESVIKEYPPESELRINDLSSGIFNMFLGIGQILGPLYGSYMTETHGYRYTCDVVSVICLTFSMVYYTLCDGQEAFRNSRWENDPEDMFEHEVDDAKSLVSRSRVKMHGMQTPVSGPSDVKSLSSMLRSNGFRVRVKRSKLRADSMAD